MAFLNETGVAELWSCIKDAAVSKVGDTVRTYRTDLGDKWALCNGDMFDPNEYPELAEVTPDMLTLASTPHCISKSPFYGYYTHGVTKIGEYFLWFSYDSTGKALQLHYSKDRFETWQTVAVVSSSDTISNAKLYYIKGVWYILYAKSNKVYLHYCTDEFVTGTWSSAVTVASGCGTVLNMWFNEATQQYMIASSGYGSGSSNGSHYPYLLASYDYTFSSTSVTKLNNTSSGYAYCAVTDTQYIYVGCSNYSTFEIVYGSLASPTNANFHQVTVASSDVYTRSGASYTNGKLFVPIQKALRVFNTIDDLSDYQDIALPDTFNLAGANVIYANGKYVTICYTGSGSSASVYLCAFDTENGAVDYVNLTAVKDANGNSLVTNSYSNFASYSGTFGEIFDNCFLIMNTGSLFRIPLYMLPISSPAPMREYIKVKEGI